MLLTALLHRQPIQWMMRRTEGLLGKPWPCSCSLACGMILLRHPDRQRTRLVSDLLSMLSSFCIDSGPTLMRSSTGITQSANARQVIIQDDPLTSTATDTSATVNPQMTAPASLDPYFSSMQIAPNSLPSSTNWRLSSVGQTRQMLPKSCQTGLLLLGPHQRLRLPGHYR